MRGRISAEFVESHAGDPRSRALLAEARALAGRADFDTPRTIRLLQDWIDADKKATPLKTLQGLIWDDGFRRGELVGDVYADVPPALRRWHDAGIRLYVYSSGSVQAQRLVFRLHAVRRPHAALLRLFRYARRLEARAGVVSRHRSGDRYVAWRDPVPVRRVGELDAAQAAGLRTMALDRGEACCRNGIRIRSPRTSTK